MKYDPEYQVTKIAKLRDRLRHLKREIELTLNESSELTNELRAEYGQRFVVDGTAYQLVYRAKGHGFGGNMDWLEVDPGVKVIS